MLNTQEQATTLAALRLMQRTMGENHAPGHLAGDHFTEVEPLSLEGIDELCEKINTMGNSGTLVMRDWRAIDDPESLPPGDDQRYQLSYRLGNQNTLCITDTQGNTSLDLILEINHGVPALHISDQDSDALLHVHRAQGGLVLTPDSPDNRFNTSAADRYSYNDSRSLTIK